MGMADKGYLSLDGGQELIQFLVNQCAISDSEIRKIDTTCRASQQELQQSSDEVKMQSKSDIIKQVNYNNVVNYNDNESKIRLQGKILCYFENIVELPINVIKKYNYFGNVDEWDLCKISYYVDKLVEQYPIRSLQTKAKKKEKIKESNDNVEGLVLDTK